MGRLVEGTWVTDDAAAASADGTWTRTPTVRRSWIRADGSTPHPPEAGRYHLWLAWSCTWSQRAWITRNLCGLRDAVSLSLAHWHRNDGGWWFADGLDDLHPSALQAWEEWDAAGGFRPAEPVPGLCLHEVYTRGHPRFTGRATVPVLWDRQRSEVVSHESADIVRMLATELRGVGAQPADLVPDDLKDAIDATNAWVYAGINNGVYRAGFAGTQEAYEAALGDVFAALDRADDLLARHRYLCGSRLTEADVRLFPTLVRFDAVYHSHFKCSLRRIADYRHLGPYLRDLYQTPGFAETVRIDLYKLGYMGRSERLNPSRVIPRGPALDLDAPHGRA